MRVSYGTVAAVAELVAIVSAESASVLAGDTETGGQERRLRPWGWHSEAAMVTFSLGGCFAILGMCTCLASLGWSSREYKSPLRLPAAACSVGSFALTSLFFMMGLGWAMEGGTHDTMVAFCFGGSALVVAMCSGLALLSARSESSQMSGGVFAGAIMLFCTSLPAALIGFVGGVGFSASHNPHAAMVMGCLFGVGLLVCLTASLCFAGNYYQSLPPEGESKLESKGDDLELQGAKADDETEPLKPRPVAETVPPPVQQPVQSKEPGPPQEDPPVLQSADIVDESLVNLAGGDEAAEDLAPDTAAVEPAAGDERAATPPPGGKERSSTPPKPVPHGTALRSRLASSCAPVHIQPHCVRPSPQCVRPKISATCVTGPKGNALPLKSCRGTLVPKQETLPLKSCRGSLLKQQAPSAPTPKSNGASTPSKLSKDNANGLHTCVAGVVKPFSNTPQCAPKLSLLKSPGSADP
mmetsp:Transcript_54360/g.100391  ORF Transcript_54360/g.100391 Transcript_54360/m.100391 type:complete len:468 (+) Transcript_54360:90-1493(+)